MFSMGVDRVALLGQCADCTCAPHAEHGPLLLRTASIAILAKVIVCLGWQCRKPDASTMMVNSCVSGMWMCKDHFERSEPVVVAIVEE